MVAARRGHGPMVGVLDDRRRFLEAVPRVDVCDDGEGCSPDGPG